jgi:hypothetical protein
VAIELRQIRMLKKDAQLIKINMLRALVGSRRITECSHVMLDCLNIFGMRMIFCAMSAMTEDGESVRTMRTTRQRMMNNKNQVPW